MADFDLGGLLNKALEVATPFAQKYAYGSATASDLALLQERQRLGLLNGSAANDPKLALNQSPRGLFDFLFGSSTGKITTGGIVLLVVAGLALFFIMRRR